MKNFVLIIFRKLYSFGCKYRGITKKYKSNIVIGKGLICEKNVEIHTYYGGKVYIGDNCELRSGCKILTYGGIIKIGNKCSVNPYTLLYGQGNLTIGNNVRIAGHCVIIPSNHNFSDSNSPIINQGLTNIGITIKDDVWIGCGVRILDGVVIAEGCVIGAGSVVTKSTIPYGIYAGVPAKLINLRK